MLLTMCGKRESHTASDICRPHVLKQVAIISTGLDELECIEGYILARSGENPSDIVSLTAPLLWHAVLAVALVVP